jgi:hypothetical protein
MLTYKKENGFPMSISIETADYIETAGIGELWEGYESIVTDEDCNIIDRFTHSTLRGRLIWVAGFFAALKINNPDLNNEWENKNKWKGPEIPLSKKGKSNLKVWDWIVTKEDKIMRITHNDDPAMPFKIIKRFATRGEAKNAKEINKLVQNLQRLKAQNKDLWMTYGSELCTGDMIGKEETIELKIKMLADEGTI